MSLPPGIPKVLVRYAVVEFLTIQAGLCLGKPEQGGIFIGQYRTPHIEITDYTRPGKTDRSALYSFSKSDPIHQSVATARWHQSRGTETYIGEWHSHPYGPPLPSTVDTNTWQGISDKTSMPMVFAIAAPEGWALYTVNQSNRRFKPNYCRYLSDGTSGKVFAIEPGSALPHITYCVVSP